MSSTIVRFAPTLAVFALVVVWAFELDDQREDGECGCEADDRG